jgi:endonuclease/exonuclease/phosphatase family metal-dependent hydrolase
MHKLFTVPKFLKIMPYYPPIKNIEDKVEQHRTIDNIKKLRVALDHQIPQRTNAETLLLATWNIREFRDGKRLTESYYYIAEIIERFDLVAIQEVSADLKALEKLVSYLGKHWNYIVTDATDGSAGGGERMAFVFDSRKITFKNIAGEIVLPTEKLMEGGLQFARTPFLAAFQAGWFKFTLCTVHIYYGEDSANSDGMKRRVEEIGTIAKWLQKKSKNDNSNYVLLGDFNIIDPTHQTMNALENNGFHIPTVLKSKPTDLGGTKHYDQIAFKVKDEDMTIFNPNDETKAGAFAFQDVVFTEDECNIYEKYFESKNTEGKTPEKIKQYYKSKWRTFQMSDHIPMWVELRIDFSEQYLDGILSAPNQ